MSLLQTDLHTVTNELVPGLHASLPPLCLIYHNMWLGLEEGAPPGPGAHLLSEHAPVRPASAAVREAGPVVLADNPDTLVDPPRHLFYSRYLLHSPDCGAAVHQRHPALAAHPAYCRLLPLLHR